MEVIRLTKKCGPCYDNTIRFNKALSGLIRYRYGTAEYLIRLRNELKNKTIKYNTQQIFPYDIILEDKIIEDLIRINIETAMALENIDRKYPSNYHKQFTLSFIQADISYFDKLATVLSGSSNAKLSNENFIKGIRKMVSLLNDCYLYAQSIPVGGE